MSYDIHITKANDWTLSAENPITNADLSKASNLLMDYKNVPFLFQDGRITLCGADYRILGLMIEIANRIGARVQGDDGEYYENENGQYSLPSPNLFMQSDNSDIEIPNEHKKFVELLRSGDKIWHPKYGVGEITEVNGGGIDTELIVLFTDLAKPKRLLAHYAPIKPFN